MQVNTGQRLWLETYPDHPTYAPLQEDLTCDVVVLGGGEAGALCSYFLSEQNVETVLLEQYHVGHGSTSANTGLLQFSNDAPLFQLAESLGVETAVRFYKLCQKAVNDLGGITASLLAPSEYIRRDSLYYASSARDVKKIEQEVEVYRRFRFPVEYLTKEEVAERFPFQKEAALYTTGDAEINPYRLAHALIQTSARKNLRVYEQTEVASVHHETDGGFNLIFRTQTGFTVKAKKAVFATGYETQERQPTPGAILGSTYAIATEPIADFSAWSGRCLIWETARPYLYVRTTADNRILVGGLDETAIEGTKRDNPLEQKAQQLLQELKKLFPSFADVKIAYQWASTFGGTKDGLPFIGEHPLHPNCYYALGYGGNGTVYSTIAAEILTDLILQKENADALLFGLERMR